MRITFITDTLSSGGSERVISVIANGLSKKYDVNIICLRGHSSFYNINSNIHLLFLEKELGNSWLKKFVWLRRNIPDDSMVIAFMVPVYIFTLSAFLFRHVPTIVSERNDPNAASLLRKILRRLLIGRSQAIVVQTQDIRKYFPQKLWKKIQIIYNPISSKYIWKSGLIVKKDKTIINIGRLSPQKNHKMLIDAFAIVSKSHPDYKLHIYGEGEIHSEISNYISQKGLSDKVILKGRCNNMEDILPHAEIFVLSSDYEGMSNALVEAMYVGIPVVTTSVSGTEELIANGKNGYIVPIKDYNALASRICILIENKKLAKSIARNETEIKSKVELNVITKQWESLILSVKDNYNIREGLKSGNTKRNY